jgi:hypothetical protein
MKAAWWRRDEPGLFAHTALTPTENPDMLMQVNLPLSFMCKRHGERAR